MTDDDPLLTLATFDQIVEELQRRYNAGVVSVHGETLGDNNSNTFEVRFFGGSYLALGLSVAATDKLRERCKPEMDDE